MRRYRHLVGPVVWFCALVLLVAAVHAADIAGTWIGTTQVPDQGTDQVTLVLKKAADGDGYTGTIVDSLGMVAAGTELRNVSFADDVLACSFSLTDGAVITLKLKADGTKLTGEWTHQDGGTGTIVFERKAEKK